MLLTKAAYARHCSVSRQTVYDWVAKGEVVMSGNKIDVEVTEQMQHGNESSESNDDLILSASQVIEWIHTNQDKFPAAQSQDEAKQLLEAATQLISYDIEYLRAQPFALAQLVGAWWFTGCFAFNKGEAADG